MKSRTIELTLNEDQLIDYIEMYLRSLKIVHEYEDVEIYFEGGVPLKAKLKLTKPEEVTLNHYKC